jgi:uncharacterized protein YegP (UPF0339 family)
LEFGLRHPTAIENLLQTHPDRHGWPPARTKDAVGGQFMLNLKAANGEIIFTSETHVARAGASDGITSVRINSLIDARYHTSTSQDGQHYFVLKAANGERLGRSEMYTSVAGMQRGMASVRANASSAAVEDLTRRR